MLADDIAFWSTTRQAAAVRAREFSARALFELYTARIERLNTAINAIVTLDLDRAHEMPRRSTNGSLGERTSVRWRASR